MQRKGFEEACELVGIRKGGETSSHLAERVKMRELLGLFGASDPR
jgi:hypothetical protein